MNRAFAEDKTCRICGTVDASNTNLFDPKHRSFLYSILTIFPLTMYESDPLPKNICKKCSGVVANIHDECKRLVKVQQKWIERVRINQPDHPYVTVLNIVEECHQNMLTRIKEVAPDFIYKNMRLVRGEIFGTQQYDLLTNANKSQSHLSENFNTYPDSGLKTNTLNSLSFDFDEGPKCNDSNRSTPSFDEPLIANQKRDSIMEIQHKLESNGCTLLVKGSSNESKLKLTKNRSLLTESCPYCPEKFPNQKFLAKHQLIHLTISDRRIFDKKYLEKTVRRGRLIPVDGKKCIRCLNCWKLFEDNRKILEHWSNADCEFFCQICGLEFARTPKQLREHVLEEHGITYKSSRRQVANIPDAVIINRTSDDDIDVKPILPLVMPKLQPQVKNSFSPVKKTKLTPGGRVKCNLCSCTFPNYQSKNSHMRAHKREMESTAKVQKEEETPPILKPMQIKRERDSDDAHNDDNEPNLLVDMSTDGPQVKREKLDTDIPEEDGSSHLLLTSAKNVPIISSVVGLAESTAKAVQLSVSPVISKTTQNTAVASAPVASTKKTDQDHMQYDKMYNCHPCGKKFTSKTDLFQHKRLCQSNNKFGCRFCLRAFVTSADLQMHIMLMHKGS